jgi:hypothetical protein
MLKSEDLSTISSPIIKLLLDKESNRLMVLYETRIEWWKLYALQGSEGQA